MKAWALLVIKRIGEIRCIIGTQRKLELRKARRLAFVRLGIKSF